MACLNDLDRWLAHLIHLADLVKCFTCELSICLLQSSWLKNRLLHVSSRPTFPECSGCDQGLFWFLGGAVPFVLLETCRPASGALTDARTFFDKEWAATRMETKTKHTTRVARNRNTISRCQSGACSENTQERFPDTEDDSEPASSWTQFESKGVCALKCQQTAPEKVFLPITRVLAFCLKFEMFRQVAFCFEFWMSWAFYVKIGTFWQVAFCFEL